MGICPFIPSYALIHFCHIFSLHIKVFLKISSRFPFPTINFSVDVTLSTVIVLLVLRFRIK